MSPIKFRMIYCVQIQALGMKHQSDDPRSGTILYSFMCVCPDLPRRCTVTHQRHNWLKINTTLHSWKKISTSACRAKHRPYLQVEKQSAEVSMTGVHVLTL